MKRKSTDIIVPPLRSWWCCCFWGWGAIKAKHLTETGNHHDRGLGLVRGCTSPLPPAFFDSKSPNGDHVGLQEEALENVVGQHLGWKLIHIFHMISTMCGDRFVVDMWSCPSPLGPPFVFAWLTSGKISPSLCPSFILLALAGACRLVGEPCQLQWRNGPLSSRGVGEGLHCLRGLANTA